MFFLVSWSKHDRGHSPSHAWLARSLETRGWPARETLTTPEGDLLSCFGAAGVSGAVRDGGLFLAGDVRLDTLQGRPVEDAPFAELAEGYRQLGRRLPRACVGDLSLAIIDPGGRRLLAFGDRLGVHPLYWQETPHAVLVTNVPAGFSILGAGNDRPDSSAIRQFTLWSNPPDGATFLRGRKRLLPGHCLHADRQSGEVRVERYWHPDEITVTSGLKDREVVAEARRLAAQAVRRCLPASGCVGLEVSAGLDSSLVAALAGREGRRRALDFAPAAMVYPDWALSALPFERADPREPVSRLLESLDLPPARFIDDIGADMVGRDQRSVRRLEAPWSLGRVKAELQGAFAERGARVFLTGEGGNEALSRGGGEVLAEYLARRRYLTFVREAWRRPPRDRPWSAQRAAERLMFLFLPGLQRRLQRRAQGDDSTQSLLRAILRRFAGTAVAAEELERQVTLGAERAVPPRLRSVHDSIAHALQWGVNVRAWEGMYLEAADRGLDVRHPLLDTDLVSFCLSLPGEHFQRDRYDRRLIRAVGEGLVPDEIRLHRGSDTHGLVLTRAQVWREREQVIAYLERVRRHPAVTEYFNVEEMIAFLRGEENFVFGRRGVLLEWAVVMVGLRLIVGLEAMG